MNDPQLDNPYAPPEAPLIPPKPAQASVDPATTDEEATRLAGLRHERFVRALGPASFASSFIILVSILFGALGARQYMDPFAWERVPYAVKVSWIVRMYVVPPLMMGLHLALGFAFRNLEPWARRWQIGLSSVVLGSFVLSRMLAPYGISDIWAFKILAFGVAHVVILYRLTGTKGAMVFSEEYHQAVEATPGISRKLGPGLMTLAIFGGIFAGWGDDSLARIIALILSTRVMAAHPQP